MKTTLLAAMLALVLAGMTAAQTGSSTPSDQATGAGQAAASNSQTSVSTDGQKMSGKISADGKTFTADNDHKTYTIANASSLKGFEGQQVMLVGQVDPDANTIRVVQVGGSQP